MNIFLCVLHSEWTNKRVGNKNMFAWMKIFIIKLMQLWLMMMGLCSLRLSTVLLYVLNQRMIHHTQGTCALHTLLENFLTWDIVLRLYFPFDFYIFYKFCFDFLYWIKLQCINKAKSIQEIRNRKHEQASYRLPHTCFSWWVARECLATVISIGSLVTPNM